MNTITLGLFATQESAENAINELSRNGVLSQSISIIMIDQDIARKVCEVTGSCVAEGILEGLIALGLPQEEVKFYETNVKTGAILLGVPTVDPADNVRAILEKHQGSQIRSINKSIYS